MANNLGLGFSFYADDKATPALQALRTQLQGVQDEAKKTQEALKFRLGGGGGGGRGGGGGGFPNILGGLLRRAGGGIMGLGGMGVGMLAERVFERQFAAKLGTGGMGFVDKLPDMAGKFEQTMAQLRAQARLTNVEFDQLKNKAIQMGIETQFAPNLVAEAMTKLAMNGKTANDVMSMIKPTLDLASASLGKLDPGKAAVTMSIVMKQFQVDAQTAADKIVRIGQISPMHIEDIAKFLPTVGSIAGSLYKQSLDDTLVMGGLARMMGMVSSRAGTSSQAMLQRMFTGKSSKTLQSALGANSVFGKDGKQLSAIDVLDKFMTKMNSMAPAKGLQLMKDVFGEQGARMVGALANGVRNVNGQLLKGSALIAYMRKEMGNASEGKGAAAAFSETLLDTWQGAKTLLKGSMEAFATIIGTEAAKAAGSGLRKMTDVLNELIKLLQKIPKDTMKTLTSFFMAASATLAFVTGTHMLRVGLAVVIPLVLKLGTSLLMFVAIAPILLGVGAAFWVIYEAAAGVLKGVDDTFQGMFGKAVLFAKGFISLIRDGVIKGKLTKKDGKMVVEGLLGEFLKDDASKKVLHAVETAYRVFYRAQAFIRGFAEGFFGAGGQKFFDGIKPLRDAFVRLAGAIGLINPGRVKELLNQPGWQFLASGFESGAKAAETFRKVVDWIANKVNWAASAEGMDTFKRIWEGLKTAVVVVGGVILAIWDIAKALGNVVIQLFGNDPNSQATMMERIESAASGIKFVIGAIVAIQFTGWLFGAAAGAAALGMGFAWVIPVLGGLVAITGIMHAMSMPKLGEKQLKERNERILGGKESAGDRMDHTASGILGMLGHEGAGKRYDQTRAMRLNAAGSQDEAERADAMKNVFFADKQFQAQVKKYQESNSPESRAQGVAAQQVAMATLSPEAINALAAALRQSVQGVTLTAIMSTDAVANAVNERNVEHVNESLAPTGGQFNGSIHHGAR